MKSLDNFYKTYKDTEWIQAEINEINKNITVLSKYKDENSYLKLECRKCNYSWEDSFNHLRSVKFKCPECSGTTPSKIRESFIKELNEKSPNIVLIGEYKNKSTKTLFKCTIHNYEWEAMPMIILKSGKCPQCKSRPNKMTLSDFKQKLSSINSNIEVLGKEYTNRETPILIKCLKCNKEWETKPIYLLKGHGCIKCNRNKKGE